MSAHAQPFFVDRELTEKVEVLTEAVADLTRRLDRLEDPEPLKDRISMRNERFGGPSEHGVVLKCDADESALSGGRIAHSTSSIQNFGLAVEQGRDVGDGWRCTQTGMDGDISVFVLCLR